MNPSFAMGIASTTACYQCAGEEPDTLNVISLLMSTRSGLVKLHWACAPQVAWNTGTPDGPLWWSLAAVLRQWRDGSAAVAIGPRKQPQGDLWHPQGAYLPTLQSAVFAALMSPDSAASVAASVVHLAHTMDHLIRLGATA